LPQSLSSSISYTNIKLQPLTVYLLMFGKCNINDLTNKCRSLAELLAILAKNITIAIAILGGKKY